MNNQLKIVLGTVIYDQSFKYYKSFCESVTDQSWEQFDVILLNDNLDKSQLDDLIIELEGKKVIIKNSECNLMAYRRIELIMTALNLGYDLLVLGDFDDKFSKNRIEQYLHGFDEDFIVFYNDLKNFEGNVIMKLPEYTVEEDILDCNYLGMSNTAINLNKVSSELLSNMEYKDIRVFDWYLFSKLLNNKNKGKKIIETYTYYRLYDANIAGIMEYSDANLSKEINVKVEHYKLLKDESLLYSVRYDYYKRLHLENIGKEQEIAVDVPQYWWGLIHYQ